MIVALLIVAALILGISINRLLSRRGGVRDDHESAGVSVTDLAHIVPTLSVLLLTFIMVESFSSWKGARNASVNEATTVVALVREARFLPPEHGVEIVRSLSCYVRSVEHVEWAAMGNKRQSNVPDYWADKVIRTIQDARGNGSAGDLAALERERMAARQTRLIESLPSVPGSLFALMVGCTMFSVFALGALTHGRVRAPIQLFALVGSSAVLIAMLLLIREIDSPFSGNTSIEPFAMRNAQSQVQEQLAEYSTRTRPGCDRNGLPTQDGSFKAATHRII